MKLSKRTQQLLSSLKDHNDSSRSLDTGDESREGSASETASIHADVVREDESDSGIESDATDDMLAWVHSENAEIAMLRSQLSKLPTDFDVGGYRESLNKRLAMLYRRGVEDPGYLKDLGDKRKMGLANILLEKGSIDGVQWHEIVGVLSIAKPPRYPQEDLKPLFNIPEWAFRSPADRLEGWALYDPQLANPLNPLRHAKAAEYWKLCDPEAKMSQNPRNLQTKDPQEALPLFSQNQPIRADDSPSAQLQRELQLDPQTPQHAQHIAISPKLFLTQSVEGGRHQTPQEVDSVSPSATHFRPERVRGRTAKGIVWDTEEGPKAKKATKRGSRGEKRKRSFDRQQVKRRKR